MMQPLRIQAIMQDGRVAGTEPWFPLDSILAAAWIRRERPGLAYLPMDGDPIIAELPFERRGQGNDWYWACSFNTEASLHEYVMYWHKRFDDQLEQYIDFGGKRGRVDTKSGKYKAYRMPLVVQLFDRLTWYAVGDLEAVQSLCEMVTHIGKKPSQGLGAVDYWTVEPWQEDWSVARDGRLMRTAPKGDMVGVGRIGQYGIRPPYWYVDHQRLCMMPEVMK